MKLLSAIALSSLIAVVGLSVSSLDSAEAQKRKKGAGPTWVRMTVDTVAGDASGVVAQMSKMNSKAKGHRETHGFMSGESLVTMSAWPTLEALEDAMLAWDGSPAAKAHDAATDPAKRRVVHFRLIRESTFDEKTPMGHLELVLHRTKAGTTRKENLKRFDAAEKDFSKGEGLLGHALGITPDGQWVHLLRWRSEADYDKTGKTLIRTKGAGGWIRSLDFQRFQVFRGDVVR